MKTKLHILAVLISIVSTIFLFAQQENDFICGTVIEESNVPLNFSPFNNSAYSGYIDTEYLASFEPISINIFFWGVNRSDGTSDYLVDSYIVSETINEPAVYNWYDTSGNLIHEGIDFETSVTFSQKYKLEVIALSDGYKDYAEAKIDLKPNRIEIFYPNPASDQAHVNYIINQGENAYLSVVPMYGGVSLTDTVSNNYILDLNNNTRTFNLNNYSEGLYKIILVVNGEISDTKTLIKH